MTITPDQARSAYEWAQMAADNNSDPTDAPWRVVARHYIDTVEAPAPTLAAELRELGALLEEEGGAGAKSTVWARDLAVRAEQIEQEVTEADRDRDEALRWVDNLTRQRDEARAEVERLKAIHHTTQPPHSRGLHS